MQLKAWHRESPKEIPNDAQNGELSSIGNDEEVCLMDALSFIIIFHSIVGNVSNVRGYCIVLNGKSI